MTCMFAMELGARGGSGDETVAILQNNDGLDSVKRQWLWKPGLFHSFRLTIVQFLDTLSRLQCTRFRLP